MRGCTERIRLWAVHWKSDRVGTGIRVSCAEFACGRSIKLLQERPRNIRWGHYISMSEWQVRVDRKLPLVWWGNKAVEAAHEQHLQRCPGADLPSNCNRSCVHRAINCPCLCEPVAMCTTSHTLASRGGTFQLFCAGASDGCQSGLVI